jgi:signal transduction histidine kinase
LGDDEVGVPQDDNLGSSDERVPSNSRPVRSRTPVEGAAPSAAHNKGDPGTTPANASTSEGMLAGGSWRFGLPSKLLVLTIIFVMLAEVLIFVPSIANFRVSWLTARLTSARLAALAAEAVPGGVVPQNVKREILSTAQVRAVAIKKDMMRRLVLPSETPLVIDASFDLRQMPADTLWEEAVRRLELIGDALAVFFASEGRIIRVYGRPTTGLDPESSSEEFIEIVLPEAPLRAAMIQHGLNILILSIIISMIAAALVYFALIRVLVQPMMRLTRSMLYFSEKPEDPARVIEPSRRRDEIGIAERELQQMQLQLAQALHQKNRLAQLGLAVSKINHDLRNMLASAQLMSDRLASLPDPTVQRFAPKLIASLDRAINFCNSSLKFGRAQEAPPRREVFALAPLVEEVGEGLDLPRPGIEWQVHIEPSLHIDADREYLYRILNNICRNAVQALESRDGVANGWISVSAARQGRRVVIDLTDNGPGVPERARANLFRAFQGGVRKGGSGLGLAISAELVAALGGTITLDNRSNGAAFRIEIPDRDASRI